MHVDEAWHDMEAGRVDDACGGCRGEVSDRSDHPIHDADIRVELRITGAVQNPTATNQDVEGLSRRLGGGSNGKEPDRNERGDVPATHGDSPACEVGLTMRRTHQAVQPEGDKTGVSWSVTLDTDH